MRRSVQAVRQRRGRTLALDGGRGGVSAAGGSAALLGARRGARAAAAGLCRVVAATAAWGGHVSNISLVVLCYP